MSKKSGQPSAVSSQLSDHAAEAFTDLFRYKAKLAAMSPRELILEVLGSNAADYLCVVALMDRVLPGWEKQFTDEETENSPPSIERFAPLSLGPKPKDALNGVLLIAQERHRQRTVEQWTPEHDDKHDRGQLSAAGASYAMAASAQVKFGRNDVADITPPSQWPWAARWWKLSSDPIRTLVKAGALIAAEIDRLQRLKK